MDFRLVQEKDYKDVETLFGEMHAFNSSLDVDFSLADDWTGTFCKYFKESFFRGDMLWLLATDMSEAIGLLIASVHKDSLIFRNDLWVEIQALYVALEHRRKNVAKRLLEQAYLWTEDCGLAKAQLFVTLSNVSAQKMYISEGFEISQVIMRKQI